VKRCQNYNEDPARRDPVFDDGGFFFIPDDEVQNKAGIAGLDRWGRQRFRSYGTMTADGLRALVRCGLGRGHPRVTAARRWLERNFSAEDNPGEFSSDRAVLQNATYYYWTWAVTHALLATRPKSSAATRSGSPCPINVPVPTHATTQPILPSVAPNTWALPLAEELLRRQRADGSWVNDYTDAKEDDPLVATPWAAAALAIIRDLHTRKSHHLISG
jgi:hypothetical protein